MKSLIEDLSRFLAVETGQKQEDAEVLAYSLQILTTTVLGYIIIIIVGLLFGVLKYALTAAIVVAVVRVFSGGAHASSPWRCMGFGGIIFPGIGLLAQWAHKLIAADRMMAVTLPSIIIIWFVALWSVLRYAPADSPGKPITTLAQREKLRKYSLLALMILLAAALLSLSQVFWQIDYVFIFAGALGLFWQAFTLTAWGYSFIDVVDAMASKCTSGRRM